MNDKVSDLQKWEPDLGEAGRAHLEALRRDLGPQIALVRQIRSAMGLSQTDLADLLNVTQGAASKIERKGDPSLSTLAKIAGANGKRIRLVVESHDGEEVMSLVVPSAG